MRRGGDLGRGPGEPERLPSHRETPGFRVTWLDRVEDTPLARAVGCALFIVVLVGGCMLPGIV